MSTSKSAVDVFESFFKENSPYIYIDKTQTSEKNIRIKDTKSNIYLNIGLEDVVYDIFNDSKENFMEFLNDNPNIGYLLLQIATKNIYSYCNKHLKQWLFYQKPENRVVSGFLEVKQNYAEFELEENYDFINANYFSMDDVEILTHFYMGDIEVRISSPSDVFRMLFFHHIDEEIIGINYIGWNEKLWKNRLTISFKNIKGKNKEDEINNILHEALFLLRLYNKEIFRLGIYTYYNHKYIKDFEKYQIKYFPKSNYSEAFSFYIEAHKYKNDMKFLNFYRVLEYFFEINKQELAICAVNKYNESVHNIETRNNQLHETFETIYINDERSQLKNLLKNVHLINYTKKVIEDNIDEKMSIEFFGEWLYQVRNSIVHSKESSRKVPQILKREDIFVKKVEKNEYKVTMLEWFEIIEELCLICIQHFCYNNKFEVIKIFLDEE